VKTSRDSRAVHDEHLRIVEAIEKNLPDEAERLARHHVEKTRQVIEQQAAKNDFNPKWVADARK